MYEYRQVLVRMRQGDSDRAIARSKLMGRDKAGEVRALAEAQGWLDRERPLPRGRRAGRGVRLPSTALDAVVSGAVS